jgi:hypothetical protein
MTQDHNDIYTIVERLRVIEEGLNTNQRSVNQLDPTFKPKTVAVLTAKTDPKNPMAGKLVGGNESIEDDEEPLEEAVTSEDTLSKVKASFADYLKSIADEIKQDTDLKDKRHEDGDIKQKSTVDRTLVAKQQKIKETDSELGSALSGVIPAQQPAGEPGVSIKESGAVKTITNECGLWEVHGNETAGFEIRRGGQRLPTRFRNLDEAEMALEMFAARRQMNDSADYIDEA